LRDIERRFRFYDFFAGAGLATLALADRWQCAWANDIDPRKGDVYRANFGTGYFVERDVARVDSTELPVPVDMAWASFPCQDLSLAGWRRGLSAERSGTFWAFWRIMRDLRSRGEAPPLIVLENVPGLLQGGDFQALCEAVAALDMQLGALVMDARWFVPQSRARVFVVAAADGVEASTLWSSEPEPRWTPPALRRAYENMPASLRARWRWWSVPKPDCPPPPLAGLIERGGDGWNTPEQTRGLLRMMTPRNRAKLRAGGQPVGFLYRRMRAGVQRAEVRFDGLAGCLRTPRGGSSRQTVVVVEDGAVRSRLLSPREAARLMGVPDSFALPERYNEAYQAMGDGVAVPVVRWLSHRLLIPLVRRCRAV